VSDKIVFTRIIYGALNMKGWNAIGRQVKGRYSDSDIQTDMGLTGWPYTLQHSVMKSNKYINLLHKASVYGS